MALCCMRILNFFKKKKTDEREKAECLTSTEKFTIGFESIEEYETMVLVRELQAEGVVVALVGQVATLNAFFFF